MGIEVLLSYDERMVDHDPGDFHPEQPARLPAVVEGLQRDPIAGTCFRTPEPCPRPLLERIHSPRYLETLERARGKRLWLDPDTSISEGSIEAMYLAAGAAVQGLVAVAAGEARTAFALVRPPGHHAEHSVARGFCLVNNIAVAALHAREALGFKRVLVVDWDVHHGNGTQQAFEDRDDVLYFSAHRYPFFPGSGALSEVGIGAGRGYTLNAPLPPGVGDDEFLSLCQRILVPVSAEFKPDIVLVSAGFDGHFADPLGGMRQTTEGFRELCALVRRIADEYADGKLLLVLEGGYDLAALHDCVRVCVEVMAGSSPAAPAPRPSAPVVDRICAAHAKLWPIVGGQAGVSADASTSRRNGSGLDSLGDI